MVSALAKIGILNIKHLWVRNSSELIVFELALSRARRIPKHIRDISIQIIHILQLAELLLRAQEKGVDVGVGLEKVS